MYISLLRKTITVNNTAAADGDANNTNKKQYSKIAII